MSSVDAAASGKPRSATGMIVFCVVTQMTLLAASSAPTPLYHLYQELWGLSPLMLTVIFAAYVASLLAALLTFGSLSDHVGRRPVIFAALLVNALAMVLFITAESAAALIEARLLQGLGAGIATSSVGAALLDCDKERGPLINGISPFVGMALGALGASALVSYAPAPTRLVYILLLGAFVILSLVIWAMPVLGQRRPGALASLRPHVGIPPQAVRAMLLASPVNLSAWALGGFYLSLMPSLVRVATGLQSPFIGGIVVTTLTLSGAAAVLLVNRRPPLPILRGAALALAGGIAITLGGVHLQSVALMLAGTLVAGLGFGPAFFGALRLVLPLAAPDQRAGLFAAFYIESYLAFSIPAVLAGLLAPSLGLALATYCFGGVLILLSLVSFAATVVSIRRGA